MKTLLIGMYDYGNISLAPRVLKSYAEKFNKSGELGEIKIADLSIFDNPIETAVKRIKEENPDVIGFSTYVWNFKEILEIMKQVKGVKIIGGPMVTGIERELIQTYPQIDIIVTGEGEIPFAKLLEYFNGNGKLEGIPAITTKNIQNPCMENPIELDTIPSIYKDLFKDYPEMNEVNLETSRGCPMGCGYCTWGRGKKIMRYYSIERIKEDLDIILGQKKVDAIYICDSNILVNKERAKEILRYIAKKRPDVLVRYEFNAEFLDDEIIDLMANLPNNEFNFGIQSTNPRALKDMGRPFNREKFEENYGKVLEKVKNPTLSFDLIYGLPGDDIEGYKESLNYAMSLDVLNKLEKIITYPLIVLPGSRFYANMGQLGIKLLDNGSNIIRSNYTFSEEDLELARKYSFFVSLLYLNRALTKAVKMYAADKGIRPIDAVIEFMESFPFDISEGAYPDMVPSFKEHYAHRNAVFARVLQEFDKIIDTFKEFSGHKYDKELEDYEKHFAAKYYKLRKFSGVDTREED
jgi:radical SAM superfamily enzyme YgiQ (UPF0313 family)